jgi:predicted nucleic acid-binding protein
LIRRAWELRHNMTPYDAAYVSLAEALACVFVTWDRRLASTVGPRCEIDLLAPA